MESLLPFKTGSSIEVTAASLGIQLGEKSRVLTLLSLLQKNGVVEFKIENRREVVGYHLAFPIQEKVEIIVIEVNTKKFDGLKMEFGEHIVTADYDELMQQLTLSTNGTTIGTIRFKESGNNLWMYVLERIDKRVYLDHILKEGVITLHKKSLYKPLANHGRFSKVLKHITYFNQHSKFVVIHRKSLVSHQTLEEMKTALKR